ARTLAGRLVGREPAARGPGLGGPLRSRRPPLLGELTMALLPDPSKAGMPTLIGFLAGLAFATFIAPASTEGFIILVLIVMVIAIVVARLLQIARRGSHGDPEPPVL